MWPVPMLPACKRAHSCPLGPHTAGTWQSGLDLADPLNVELPDDGLPTGLPDLDLPPADPLGQDHREGSSHFLQFPGMGDLTSPGALLPGAQVRGMASKVASATATAAGVRLRVPEGPVHV